MSTEKHPTPPSAAPSADPILQDTDQGPPQGSPLISLYWDNASHDDERDCLGAPPLWSPPPVNRLLRLLRPPNPL